MSDVVASQHRYVKTSILEKLSHLFVKLKGHNKPYTGYLNQSLGT